MPVAVELFTASWCPSCASAGRTLHRIVSDMKDETLTFRLVDVIDEFDYAVALGVVATPAVAINGELVFTALPSDDVLRKRLQGHLMTENSDQTEFAKLPEKIDHGRAI